MFAPSPPPPAPLPPPHHARACAHCYTLLLLLFVPTTPGMMAIPHAFYACGTLVGVAMLAGVAWLTHITLCALITASAVTGVRTYAGLTTRLLGPCAALALQLSVLGFCFGFGVVYLVRPGVPV